MRFLFFASFFIIIFLSGCQSLKPRHLKLLSHDDSSNTLLPTANCKLPTLFSSPNFEKALFKATMDIREHHLTGLVLIKKIRDPGLAPPSSASLRFGIRDIHSDTVISSVGSGGTYRVVFSNEFGMTYFDLEIGSDSIQVHYCFEPINKKALWNLLKTDFRLLLANEEASNQVKSYLQDETNYLVCQHKQGNLDRWDLFTPAGDTLVEVRGKSNLADLSFITFTGYQHGFPSRITIFNPFIKLKLFLSLISVN